MKQRNSRILQMAINLNEQFNELGGYYTHDVASYDYDGKSYYITQHYFDVNDVHFHIWESVQDNKFHISVAFHNRNYNDYSYTYGLEIYINLENGKITFSRTGKFKDILANFDKMEKMFGWSLDFSKKAISSFNSDKFYCRASICQVRNSFKPTEEHIKFTNELINRYNNILDEIAIDPYLISSEVFEPITELAGRYYNENREMAV